MGFLQELVTLDNGRRVPGYERDTWGPTCQPIYKCEAGHRTSLEVYEGTAKCLRCARNEKYNTKPLTNIERHRDRARRAARMKVFCSAGHEMIPGPIGLHICEICTARALREIKAGR